MKKQFLSPVDKSKLDAARGLTDWYMSSGKMIQGKGPTIPAVVEYNRAVKNGSLAGTYILPVGSETVI